jgi:endonuclease YncB( thermonuclease family)
MLRSWSAALLFLAALPMGARAAEPCAAGKAKGTGIVAEIIDGATIRLQDGRQVRLSGIEPPVYRHGSGDRAATELLRTWLLGKSVEFRHSSARPDRYGRTVAQLFSDETDDGWVQGRLIAAGAGRVFVSPEQRSCSEELLSIEAGARRHGLGLWADAAFRPRRATDPELTGLGGVFALVEGRVVSTSKTGSAIYVDFAGKWRTNFTAIIDARAAAQFDKAGKGAEALRGKWVRVRGWVYAWNGPAVKLLQPDAIEIVAGPADTARRRMPNGDAGHSD